LDCLNNTYGYKNDDAIKHLSALISTIIGLLADKSNLNNLNINFYTKTFIKELNNEPVNYGSIVELDGIILATDNIIHITDLLSIKKPKVEDLEHEFYSPSISGIPKNPSAILNIECLAKGSEELQIYQNKVMTLLKLFRVGSVKDLRSIEYSDSILNPFASGITNSGSAAIFETYLLSDKDEIKLSEFWNKFFNLIPEGFFEFSTPENDYLTIAFNRYNDSLFNMGIQERISVTLMGLEALFLKTDERLELKYKLCIRISKLLGLIGYDAIKINRIINEAYNIRSNFVHGGHLEIISKVDRFKSIGILEKNETIKDFIKIMIEILRICLLLNVLLRNGKADTKGKQNTMKEQFIDCIDSALIDNKTEKKLKTLLESNNVYLERIINQKIIPTSKDLSNK